MSDGERETKHTQPEGASRDGRRADRVEPAEKRGGYRGSAGVSGPLCKRLSSLKLL